MRKDVELLAALSPIMAALAQLFELVEDTYMEVGSEAYTAALLVCQYARAAGKGSALDRALISSLQANARKEILSKSALNRVYIAREARPAPASFHPPVARPNHSAFHALLRSQAEPFGEIVVGRYLVERYANLKQEVLKWLRSLIQINGRRKHLA